MNNNIRLILFYVFVILTGHIYAQQNDLSLRQRLARKQQVQQTQQNRSLPNLTLRAEKKNQSLTQDMSNATWMREIYRFLDLSKGKNAALYYPLQPVEGRMNLYTLIFELMANGNLTGYKFLDGREDFSENNKEDFKDVLEKLEIPFEQQGDIFKVNEYDIPSNEVLGYYVKEAWYFDQRQSVVDIKTIAICPVVFRQDDFGIGAERLPQFWIPYESIRPYAARMPIMTSDKNNVMDKTIDDFFRLHLFEGEIYKTSNLENKLLAEKYPSPSALKAAQEQVEKELVTFERDLWVTNDTVFVKPNDQKKKMKAPKKSSSLSVSFSARDRRK